MSFNPNEQPDRETPEPPHCHICKMTAAKTDLIQCQECGDHICCACASELLYCELESCSDECGAKVVRTLQKTIYALRAQLRNRDAAAERRVA
jgi:hypothetical protein